MFPGINEGHHSETSINWSKRQDRKDPSIYSTDLLKVLMVRSIIQAILQLRGIILTEDFSIPTPRIPPPTSVHPAHPPAADQERKEMTHTLGWLTEVQRLPLTAFPPHHWVKMGINQGGKYKPYPQDHRGGKSNPKQYRFPYGFS